MTSQLLRAGALVLPLLAIGCSQQISTIRVTSYEDPYFPETRDITFDRVTFYETGRGDRHIIADTRAADQLDQDAPIQMLYAHLIWKPRPGRTYANRTTSDANLVLVSTAGSSRVVYEGTGFVYPLVNDDGALALRVESGRLRVRLAEGDDDRMPADARMQGMLYATENRDDTVRMMRWVDRVAAGYASE